MTGAAALRARIALFAAGFGTFSLLYCVQPVMPIFSEEFGASPTASSLSLSLTTCTLALTIFIAGFMSESFSRRPVISVCLVLASALTLLTALLSSWPGLLVARALVGVALGGVPALAMAYAAEESRSAGAGLSMGLYIGGTALGGMSGRVITGVVADLSSWRAAMATIAIIALVAGIGVWLLLPPSRHFTARRGIDLRTRLATLSSNLRGRGLPLLYLIAFMLMGSFVSIYNYMSYRLVASPYDLNQSAIGSIFLLYLVGMIASPLCGRLADRYGRSLMLTIAILIMICGILITTLQPLWTIIGGLALITFGFFAGHAIASGWVGQLAAGSKGQATSLYLLAYYLGASIIGSYGGWFWTRDGWNGVAMLVGVILVVAVVLAVRVRPGRLQSRANV